MSICLNTIPANPLLNRKGKLFPVGHDLFAAFAHNDRIRWLILYRCSASRRHKFILGIIQLAQVLSRGL